jgi:hypothetical protein
MISAKHFATVLILIPLSFPAFAQLKMAGDSSVDPSVSSKFCPKITSITQDTADNLAESLKVSSKSIEYRGSRMSYSACCVILDTPKGPIRKIAWQFYTNKDGETIVRINTIGVKQSDPFC